MHQLDHLPTLQRYAFDNQQVNMRRIACIGLFRPNFTPESLCEDAENRWVYSSKTYTIQRYKDSEIWRYLDIEIWKYGDTDWVLYL